jgi:hypothetical protein
MFDVSTTKIGDIVRFKNNRTADYYGVVVDKNDARSYLWVNWFNHKHVVFESTILYKMNPEQTNTYLQFWSLVK